MNIDELYLAMNGRLGELLRDPAWVPFERTTATQFAQRMMEQERDQKLLELGLVYGGIVSLRLNLGFALKGFARPEESQAFEEKRNQLLKRFIDEAEQLIRDHFGADKVVIGDDLWQANTRAEALPPTSARPETEAS